jgi:hypothetical protein
MDTEFHERRRRMSGGTPSKAKKNMRTRHLSLFGVLGAAAVNLAFAQPTPTSASATLATVSENKLCTKGILPFYWEIGDGTGTLLSGSQGVNAQGSPVLATTKMNVASSAKWLYSAYVVQTRGSAANITAEDINFLHMTSGYTNLGNNEDPSGTCPGKGTTDTVNACLLRDNPANGLPYSYQNPETIGFFDYDGGHFENHASLYTTLGTTPDADLGPILIGSLAPGSTPFIYTEPLLAGGINTTAGVFAVILQHIVDGSLYMNQALGIDPVCTEASATCQALNSPIPEAWHYSIGHWVEDDPAYNGDGAFSAPGGEGFYPWVDASKAYYGLIARAETGPQKAGFQSVQCGRLLRAAWDTGVQQTGTIPKLAPARAETGTR